MTYHHDAVGLKKNPHLLEVLENVSIGYLHWFVSKGGMAGASLYVVFQVNHRYSPDLSFLLMTVVQKWILVLDV